MIDHRKPAGRRTACHTIGRWLVLFVGCVIWGLGIALTIRGRLGVAPWEVLQVAVSRLSGLSLGRVGQLIGLLLVVLTYLAARIKPRWATLVTMFFVGFFVDVWYPYLPDVDQLGWRIVMLLGGTVVIGFATGLYLRADLGAGPRDGAMFAICRLTGSSVRLARTLLELIALALGVALGGPLGWGTLAYALIIGPIVQIFMRILGVGWQSGKVGG
jgi:uncharacterized membrane protein YczE